MTDKKFKKVMKKATSEMSLSIFEYLKFYLWPFGEIKKKKKMIDYSIDKLYYHLDALNIIQKMLEVDKLKMLLMDSRQIQLFDFLSKPTIYEEEALSNKKVENLNNRS